MQHGLVLDTWLANRITLTLIVGITDLVMVFPSSGLYFHPWYLRQPMRCRWLRQGLLGNHDPPLPVFPLGTADLRHPKLVFANALYDNSLFEKRIRIRPWERARRKVVVELTRLWSRMQG